MIVRTIFFLLAAVFFTGCTTIMNLNETPIGLVNNVDYHNAEFSKTGVGNGFLVRHGGETYAVTAKHVMVIAKTPKMQFVDFAGELAEWRMSPKEDSTKAVVMGKLLNPNQRDSLTWDYLNNNWDSYNDWLVFTIKENNLEYKPLEIRSKPLVIGEKLFIVGWSYGDKTGPQRVYEYTYKTTDGDYYEIVQVKGPESLAGLSGSPVVDAAGQVVGLVSSGWEDEETGATIVAATSIENLRAFLELGK